MNVRLFVICVFFCTGSVTAAPADHYAYAWPLQTSGDSAAWQVELNAEVYAAVRDANLRDIEVVNAAGDAVPMAPRAAQMSAGMASEIELPLFVLPTPALPGSDSLQLHIERDGEGRLRRLDTSESAGTAVPASDDMIVDASSLKLPIDSLWLNWDESGAATSAQYRVSGSDDLQQWRLFNASANVLAMQQNGNSLSRRQIVLNGANAKYLRLQRLDRGAPLTSLHVSARTLAPSSLMQAARVWVDAQLQPATDVKAPPSYTYRLPAPLAGDALKLELASDNSLARVQVRSREHARDDANAWRTRAEFTAFRLRQDDSITANDEIALAASDRSQDWRVDPATPLDRAPTLRVAYRPDRFVFLAQGNGPYRLVAGSARARRGDYPVDAALAQLHARLGVDWQPPLAALGARATLQGDSALVAAPPARDWKSWILWAVLIGAAALIGGLALSLLRAQRPPA
jgi:hypothetical protein